MLGLVLGAIRRRRTQAALLFLLAAVAATGAAAAPGYIVASTQALAESAVSYAIPGERVVSADSRFPFEADPSGRLSAFTDRVRTAMALPGFEPVADVRISGKVGEANATLVYRDDACRHILLEGACPTAAGEVAVNAALAATTGLAVGAKIPLQVEGITAPPDGFRVVGVFRARAPFEPYWGRSAGTRDAPVAGERLAEGALLTPLSTFSALTAKPVNATLPQASASLDLIATPASVRQTDPQQLALAFEQGVAKLAGAGIAVKSGLRALADRIWLDQQLVFFAVPVGAVQLMALCWFALFLAVRQTAEERRLDIAKLKLHGVRRRDMWVLVAGQSSLPLIVGGAAGFALGWLLVPWTVGAVTGAALRAQVLYAAIAAAGLAVAGAVVAALLAERRMLSESVVDLGRHVPVRRAAWRTGILDVAVFTLALAGAYEVRARSADAAQVRGLSLAAPMLVALAVGLLAARLIPVVASGAAQGLLRARRLGSWLVAVHLARRSGRSRVLALLTLAVAVFCGAVLSFDVSTRAQEHRALFEVGTERVLTVAGNDRAQLLAAVRAADPSGRYAMAAVQTFGTVPVLALDTSRLSAVVPWQSGYGVPDWSQVAAMLRPDAPRPLAATGPTLRLDVTWQPVAPDVPDESGGEGDPGRGDPGDGGEPGSPPPPSTPPPPRKPPPTFPTAVIAGFIGANGVTSQVAFGPLTAGRHSYPAQAAGCAETTPCRLVSLALGRAPVTVKPGAPAAYAPGAGSMLKLHALEHSAGGPAVASPAELGDLTRWRNDLRSGAWLPQLSTTPDGLTLIVADRQLPGNTIITPDQYPAAVFSLDAPTPLPAWVAGELPPIGDIGDSRVAAFGGAVTPVRLAGRAAVLPRLGRGLIVDLEYADRLLPGEPTVGALQVWLAKGTPRDVVDALATQGLTVVAVDSTSDRLGRLAAQGPPVALRFLMLVAAAGVLLALGSFTVWASVERIPRGAELAALRRQGLRQRATRVAAFGGYLTFVGLGVAVGVLLALPLRTVGALPVFGDDWRVLGNPNPDPVNLTVAVASTLVLLGVAAVGAGLALLRAVRRPREIA
jgi:hypothetical protein